ncbi:MAG: S41 family peptidase [Deltaproteobacteria bacterium]|nr:S41 family peptidase [Deltaproteobacteria bacterium]
MPINRHNSHRPWLIIGIVIILCTVGSGFYQNLSAEDEETYKGLKVFSDVIELIQKNYVDPVDTQKLIEKAIQGMVSSLDPHSALLPPDDFEELRIDTKGKFTGIGIHITMRNGYVTVVSPIEGTPAYKAGIKAMDKIVKVDNMETTDLRDAVNRMRGPKGTTVVVTVVRDGTPDPIEFTLVRDVIPIESVKKVTLKPGYGYVWITNFRDKTSDDLIDALDNLEAENPSMKGLVLDLRNNPGGILNQAIKVSDIFLEDGTILTIKGREGKHSKTFKATPNDKKRNYPLVVLINGGSASASEIVAGALQDQKRALILGTTSFGKGSVQTVETLRDGYGLKFTIARYYTPSGRSIQAKGVVPDISVDYERLEKNGEKNDREDVLKEKDLKNHLDAKPLKGKQDTDLQKKKKLEEKETPQSPDALMRTRLMEDNQVLRALEILISYDIFKESQNG